MHLSDRKRASVGECDAAVCNPPMTCVHGMEFSFHNFNRVFHNLADCVVEGCGGPLCPMVPYGGCGSCVEVFKTRKPLRQ